MSEAKNEIRLNALVMRSFVNMLPKHDDVFWAQTPDDLKCDIDFAREHLLPYVSEFARLQEIEKTTDAVTADWQKRCQALEAAIESALSQQKYMGTKAAKICAELKAALDA